MKAKKAKSDRILSTRRHITLVELLIVIAIIGSIAGVVGLSIQKALREQRFKNEVEEFVSTLRLAQNLMLITDADIRVKMVESSNDSGIAYMIESDRKLPDGWDRELKRPPKIFKSIHHVSYDQASGGALDIHFFSNGAVMSKGNIALSTADTNNPAYALIRYIWLPGYPSPIKAHLDPKQDHSENEDSQITTITVHEIHAIQNAKDNKVKDDDDKDT